MDGNVRKGAAIRGAKASARERLALIEGAIREIQSRRELSPEAKDRGIRALERARARALQSLVAE